MIHREEGASNALTDEQVTKISQSLYLRRESECGSTHHVMPWEDYRKPSQVLLFMEIFLSLKKKVLKKSLKVKNKVLFFN